MVALAAGERTPLVCRDEPQSACQRAGKMTKPRASNDAVLDGCDLTAIALEAGFASHSHYTARFRRVFGCTPTALRRGGPVEQVRELRKIMTARRRQLA